MKYLILLTPTLAFANFVSETGTVTYWDKKECEKAQATECFKLPEDADTKKLAVVEVDDFEKPIKDIKDVVVVVDPETLEETKKCDEGYDIVEDKCEKILSYEKKLEKQFVRDAAKEAAKLAREQAKLEKETSCEQFKTLLADSAIDDKSKAADVAEVVRRLLGFYKRCVK